MKVKTFYKNFDIHFIGLGLGKHIYTFDIDSKFMEHFPEALFNELEIKVKLDFTKQSQVLFLLDFKLEGFLKASCDRCLDELRLPVDFNHKMIVKVTDESQENNDEDVIFLPTKEYKINLVDPIYQMVASQFPMKVSCDMIEKDCNIEYLNKIEEFQHSDGNDEVDARWEELRKLK